VPVPAADLAVINSAAESCPALSASRLAGQLMATSKFKSSTAGQAVPGGAGIAGLSGAAWRQWMPGQQARRGSNADNIVALAHEMCDLTGQVRSAQVPGDPWLAALAAFHSGKPAVVAAKGVPAGARGYVSTVNRYTTWYSQQPGFGGPGPDTTTPPNAPPPNGTTTPPPTCDNIALNRPATASSTESAAYPAANAVDGNTATRWSSAFADNQWLQVDLGSARAINAVNLNWEAAYDSAYQIQTADRASGPWTTRATRTGATGGIETVPVPATARYVRLNAQTRATVYGSSLWEFAVCGT
jgi:hypothetical protein